MVHIILSEWPPDLCSSTHAKRAPSLFGGLCRSTCIGNVPWAILKSRSKLERSNRAILGTLITRSKGKYTRKYIQPTRKSLRGEEGLVCSACACAVIQILNNLITYGLLTSPNDACTVDCWLSQGLATLALAVNHLDSGETGYHHLHDMRWMLRLLTFASLVPRPSHVFQHCFLLHFWHAPIWGMLVQDWMVNQTVCCSTCMHVPL